ncbi:MAG: hypothetical protein A3G71_06475 [Gammaproteobacteria bacterium RIFCSPLOWO2_12_FULL_38_14]|nr:MAG: hypothetical protein A3B69_00890 [Gammaproteobacteria bacterium RIFCSPHIGHO2_02_FULL_38_33]OGT75467.1 MAG: hypothetical protein A3G71_06475 [Gammaproteobacteria bacterium RIFCSPLOWO2_12_FULL_38_14]
MSLIGDIFNILKGTWNLQRTITGKQQATASGQGEFLEKSPHHLEYHENMTVQFPEVEHVFSAKKSYLFELHGDAISVFFNEDEPRFFHRFQLENRMTASTLHSCLPDIYKTNYLFQAPNRFTIIHNVTGHQKQYTSETLYTRHFYFSNVLSPDVQA